MATALSAAQLRGEILQLLRRDPCTRREIAERLGRADISVAVVLIALHHAGQIHVCGAEYSYGRSRALWAAG